jgi:hypothetical protein
MALAGNAALNLRSNFFSRAAFQRIGASTRDECESNRQERTGFHLLILESRLLIANCQLAFQMGNTGNCND